jgi:hypothetical protein
VLRQKYVIVMSSTTGAWEYMGTQCGESALFFVP